VVRPADDPSLREVRRLTLGADGLEDASVPPPAYEMRLEVALLSGTGWAGESVLDAAQAAASILAQCAIKTESVVVREFEGPARYRFLSTPVSREFAQRAGLARPAVFLVADTLHRPAFEAEAVGRGNSRTRPEMADTVWITAGARDLPVVIAHELVHVLADSGAHTNEPGNLMRGETAADATHLTAAQCQAIVSTGAANGLLRGSGPRRD